MVDWSGDGLPPMPTARRLGFKCIILRTYVLVKGGGGLVDDFRDWPWSSYKAIIADQPTKINRAEVLDWFGGRREFIDAHRLEVDERLIAHLI